MIQRSSIIIHESKSKDFQDFLKNNAKDQTFWNHVKECASKTVDKKELEKLFDK